MAAPARATLFAFDVDFGDCFLLRFTYPDETMRHVLIDFGATRATKDRLAEIAREIARLCGGKLDVLVATHRHRDHISGFATSREGDSGDIIRRLEPTLVLQPWTEDPDVPEDATGPRENMRAFASTLRGMSAFSEQVKAFADSLQTEQDWKALGFTRTERDFLAFAGENNITNRSAVNNLMAMATKANRLYLYAGKTVDVSDLLPGVTLDVLGPPTPKQHEKVRKQNPRNDEQYWLRRAAELPMQGPARHEGLFSVGEANISPERLPPNWRWMARRVLRLRKDMLLPIVRALDRAMNNTSLILLFRAGGRSLLFPGDAQWENWEYALRAAPEAERRRYRDMLADVDLYKVGHHGSLNATPKELWELFAKKGDDDDADRLATVMSTRHGIHGETPETAVPRSTLVAELKKHSRHVSTEDIEAGELFSTIEIGLG